MNDTSSPTSAPDPLVGTTVDGRYTIERALASGGMGSVYLARQKNLARPVAVKVVTNADPELVERFRREAEALSEVAHPAIVEVHDFVGAEEGAGRCYLVMSYVEGVNLEDYLDRIPTRTVSPAEAVALVTPIVSALVELHAKGIVHRDIKPANIIRFEGADGRPAVKLVDFGIARRSVDTSLTNVGYIIGTPPYMAPETLMAKPVTPVADVYSVGATLYELLAGEPPHGRGQLHEIIKRALAGPARIPARLEGTSLGWLLGQMLEAEEGRRPDALQVLNGLERVQDELAAMRIASGGVPYVTGAAPAAGAAGAPPWSTGQGGMGGGAGAPPGPGLLEPRARERDPRAPTVQLAERSGPVAMGSAPRLSDHRLAPSRLPGTLETNPGTAPTVAVTPRPGTAQAMGRAAPMMTGQAVPGGTGPTPVRRRSTWIWLGPLIAVPVVVGIVGLAFVLGQGSSGGGKSKPRRGDERAPGEARSEREVARRALGDEKGDMRPEAPERRATSTDSGERPRPGNGEWTQDKVMGLVQGCKSPKDAAALFSEAKQAEASPEPEAWRKAVVHYQAVLQCGHSAPGQRMWSARLIANIFLRLKDCGAARRNWRVYEQLSRSAGKVPKRFPRCPP